MLAKLIAPAAPAGAWHRNPTAERQQNASETHRPAAPTGAWHLDRAPDALHCKQILARPQQVPGTGIGHLTPSIASKSWLGPSGCLAPESCT